MQVGLLKNLLEMHFMFRLSHDWIAHHDLALANDTACDRYAPFSWMVSNIVGALVLVASTIELVPATRILVALFAEVCVGTASELGQIAAVVALKLDMAQTVLLAHVLLANAHVLQPAALAHELFLLHTFLLLLSKLLVLAINIAAEEGVVAARAFIKLTNMKCVFERLLIESICGVL